jgi:hypothetical protein
VGLALPVGSLPLVLLSLEADFSFSPAEAPPEGLASLEAPALEPSPLEDASPPSLVALSALEVEVPALVVCDLLDVVEVEVVCTAAASALVSVGGVISGVLLGTASETLAPPQAPSVSPHISAAHAASTTRDLTAVPCVGRRWGSR